MANAKAGNNYFGPEGTKVLMTCTKEINLLMDQREELADDMKQYYAAAKAAGIPPGDLRKAIAKQRAKDKEKLAKEQENQDLILMAIDPALAALLS